MNEAKFGRELASRPWPTNSSVLHGAPNGDLLLTLHVCVNELCVCVVVCRTVQPRALTAMLTVCRNARQETRIVARVQRRQHLIELTRSKE